MASSKDNVQLTPETVFVSPGGSLTLTASCDNTSIIGCLTWTRFVNDSFAKLDTGSTKYDECFCQNKSNAARLIINDVEPSDEGKYRVEVKQQSVNLESNVITLYVLEDVNAVCKDELNLLRYKECESIAKEALRLIFDKLVPPNGLATHLSAYKYDLHKYWKCSHDQLQDLFPSNGSPVSSKSFDIPLLYKLLRNTTTVKAPVNDWNIEPTLENINEGDDIERIHQHRNFLCHLKVRQLSDEEFESRWFDLTTAIDRLSKGTLRKPLCDLRNKKFQQKEKVTKKKYSRRGIAKDPQSEIVSKWQLEDMMFCEEIRSVKKAYDIVRKEKLTIIIGGSGSGKTATARHCALKLQKEGWQVVPIGDIREINNINISGKCTFVFDDPVGNLGLDERKLSDLERCHSDALQLFRHDSHKIIITCRKIVYNEARQYHVFDNYSVVDIEDKDYVLNISEKRKLLQAYDIETLVDLSSLDRVNLMFPLMCYMLYKNREDVLKTGSPKAVLDPRDYLLKQLDIMRKSEKSKVLYASLVFIVIVNNNFTTEDLKKTDILTDIFKKCGICDHQPYGKEIQEKMEHSENTYVIKTESGFKEQDRVRVIFGPLCKVVHICSRNSIDSNDKEKKKFSLVTIQQSCLATQQT